jgi:3-hydroxyacyl-[acyl-carrier-protein] dehydratase
LVHSDPGAGAVLVADVEEEGALDVRDVMRYLPHRYPMLLVDRVDVLVPGVSAEGVKCVSINEPYMTGHFPDYPIMPGVLIVDALAQLAGVMLRSDAPALQAESAASGPRPGVLASIQRMRFFRPVLPGDRLQLRVRLLKKLGSVHQVQAEACVSGETVASGELLLAS